MKKSDLFRIFRAGGGKDLFELCAAALPLLLLLCKHEALRQSGKLFIGCLFIPTGEPIRTFFGGCKTRLCRMQGSFRRYNVLKRAFSVRLGGNGRRSPLDAPDLFFENGHLRTKRSELFFLDADGSQLFGFFIKRGDVFFAFARLLPP